MPDFRASCASYVVAPSSLPVLDDPGSFDAALAALLPDYLNSLGIELATGWPALARLAAAARAVLLRAGFVIPDLPALRHVGDDSAQFRLPLPSAVEQTDRALRWAANALLEFAAHGSIQAAGEGLEKTLRKLAPDAPRGMNTGRLLRAAEALGVPYRRHWGNVYQFGWGSAARRLDSTFTDQTSQIGARLARNKLAAAQVLRDAGLPVPDHFAVTSEDGAVAMAERLGYPVVVKPSDKDGGSGVSADLRTAAAVRKGYQLARAKSANVLVEKHFTGNDYRVHVHKDQVYWVVHRVPGGVTGDGQRSVQALLDELNADPRRGARGTTVFLKRIPLDDEALELIGEQGLTAGSVPAAGQFVRLRRAANVASGGVPVPALERAHPDNLALAVRAARIVGLDVAGIDLLIPDIGVSWQQSGAAICEVNGQPQMSPHLPEYLLKMLLPRGGRIPTVLVAGDCDPAALAGIAQAMQRFGTVGVASSSKVSIGESCISTKPNDAFHAGWALLCDPCVDAALLHVADVAALASGLPVDRFDMLVAGSSRPDGLLGWLHCMCSGTLIAAPSDREANELAARAQSCRLAPCDPAQWPAQVAQSLAQKWQ